MRQHSTQGNDAELLDLIGAVLDGIATPEQQAQLNDRLATDPEARAVYRRYVNLHVTLKTYGTALAVPKPRTTAKKWWGRAAAVAAMIVLIIFLRLRGPAGSGSRPAPATVAVLGTVTRTTGARLSDIHDLLAVGAPVRAGTFDLSEGLAEITLSNGVQILLEAPVTIDLTGPLAAQLRNGRLVATVPPAARGFAIQTPRARVVDLGTEFGVGVHDTGDTDVQVFRGLVVTQLPTANGHTLDHQLTAGRAITIDAAGASAQPRDIPFRPDRFVRLFPADANGKQPGGQPAGPLYSHSQVEVVHVIPARSPVTVDGDLSEWDHNSAFHGACVPPYQESHAVDGMMMYDNDRLYLAAHVADPAPMRSTVDPAVSADQFPWRGGSVIVRLAVDPALDWPLTGLGVTELSNAHLDAGRRPQDISDAIVHLTMWYHEPSGRARLHISHGMDFHGDQIDPPGWQGSFRKDANGLGYTLEYAIPWSVLGAAAANRPPRARDIEGCTWAVHWSDQDGKISLGHLVEVTNPAAGPFRFLRASTWGKAVFEKDRNP